MLRAISMVFVLAWVLLKGSIVSVIELSRALLRAAADPFSVSPMGWKWLAIKIVISVWLIAGTVVTVIASHMRQRFARKNHR